MSASHQFVRAATAVNSRTSNSVITVQPLVARVATILRANHPDNHVIGAICGGDKRRAAIAVAPVHTPTAYNSRRASSSDAKSRKRAEVGAQSKIGTLVGSIACCCLS